MSEARPTCRRAPRTFTAGGSRPSDVLVVFLLVGVAWLIIAGATAILAMSIGSHGLRWLALHLAFVGGVSQLVIGVGQFFVCAFLATNPPSRKLVRAQLVLWNAATILVAAGVRADVPALAAVGGTGLLAALVLFAASLKKMERRSLQRQPWASRWYLAAAASLAIGATLGPLIAANARWTHGSLVGAHIVLNVGGWFGTAIVGTVHTFYPSLTGTRLRHPGLQRATFSAWCLGILVLAAGELFASQPVAVAGWLLLLAAIAALLVNLLRCAGDAERHRPPAIFVGVGQLCLASVVVAGLVMTLRSGALAPFLGEQRVLLAALAVAGWIGLTVTGSLLHLLALMARVRRLDRPAPAGAADRVPLAAVAAIVAGIAALLVGYAGGGNGLELAARIGWVVGYGLLAFRITTLGRRAWRAAPLRL